MTVAITRTEHRAADLRRQARQATDAAVVRRLLALALDGRKREDAARLAGMDRQGLRDWVHRHNADGIPGLADRHGGGVARRLSAEQEAAVAGWVRTGPDLAEISRRVAPGAHAVLVCDGAGWHKTGGRLRVPGNISLLRLPPYGPELNPVETIWEYRRPNKLSNTVFDTYSTIVDRCCAAWNWLTETLNPIQSVAATP